MIARSTWRLPAITGRGCNGGVVAEEIGMANLPKIDHVVVLKLENRSGLVTNFGDTLPRHGVQDRDPGRGLLPPRRCPGL